MLYALAQGTTLVMKGGKLTAAGSSLPSRQQGPACHNTKVPTWPRAPPPTPTRAHYIELNALESSFDSALTSPVNAVTPGQAGSAETLRRNVNTAWPAAASLAASGFPSQPGPTTSMVWGEQAEETPGAAPAQRHRERM